MKLGILEGFILGLIGYYSFWFYFVVVVVLLLLFCCLCHYSQADSMAQWIRAWDFLTRDHSVREVVGSNPGRGTIVGGIFGQLARFSPPNLVHLVNSKYV